MALRHIAEVRSVTGIYKEADDLKDSINLEILDLISKVYYSHLNQAINTLKINYAIKPSDKIKYEYMNRVYLKNR